MPIDIERRDENPKRVKLQLRSERGHYTLALQPVRDFNGVHAGDIPHLAPAGVSGVSEETALDWAERAIEALEALDAMQAGMYASGADATPQR